MKDGKMYTLEDYCRSVITRRQSTNHLHDLYLHDLPKYEEMVNGLKANLPKKLLSNHDNIGWIIVNIGDDLFDSRPATLPYVLTFLEFVSLVYREINGQCPWIDYPSQAVVPLPIFTYSAALAIAKTTFVPPPPPPRQVFELCNIL